MNAVKEMRTALKTYLDGIEQTLTELSELENLAETFSTVLASNHEINLEIQAASEEIAYLYGQREELFNEYHEATFSGNADKVTEVEAERDRIDARVDELHQTAEDLQGKLLQVDGTGIAEMLSRVEDANVTVFFGPRITGSKLRTANGSYQQMLPSGLLVDLQKGNDELQAEINSTKARIKGMQQWALYVPKEPASRAHNRLVDALAT